MNKLAKALFERIDIIVLIACLMITYFVWIYGERNDKTDVNLVTEQAQLVEISLTEQIENVFAFIDGVRGLYVSSDEVTDAELSRFMKATSQSHLAKSLLRINYIVKTPNKSVPEENRIEGFDTQYILAQSIDKSGILYQTNQLNFLAEDNRRKLVEQIEMGDESGATFVSDIKGVDEYNGSGFVLVVPVKKNNELVGLISALVSDKDIIAELKAMMGSDYGFSWYQKEELISKIIIDDATKTIEQVATIPVTHELSWMIKIAKVVHPSVMWNMIFGLGIFLSFMIYVVVYALSSANARGVEAGRVMTQDLEKYKLALDSASNHIVITDPEGICLYANKAAQNLTGYSNEEILGKNPRLWGGQMPLDFYVKFWDQIKKEKNVFTGIFNNKRKNGELYQAEATVSPILDNKLNLIGFVGVEEDVTKERKMLDEINANLQKLAKFNELMVGRELKMVEIKKELADLKAKYEK
jgi:PAS domain S-box-containing protein